MSGRRRRAVEREVGVDDPGLSDAANARLTSELRAALGADRVRVPEERTESLRRLPRPARARLAGLLGTNRLLIAITFGTLLIVGVIVALVTGSWWAVVGACAAHAVVTVAVATVALRLASEVEHVDPVTAARLRAEGVDDPDRALGDLVERHAPDEIAHGTAEVVSAGHNRRTTTPADDPVRSGLEQRTAVTPGSEPAEPAGAGDADGRAKRRVGDDATPRRRRLASMVVVLVMIVTVGVIVAGALAGYLGEDSPGGSAGLEQGVTLSDVIEEPARHEGRQVRISGEWADNEYFEPDRAEEVMVLGDDAGNRLLVVPNLGVEVPAMDESTAVVVEGVVRLPERTGAGYLAPDALMRDADGDVAPVVAATDVSLIAGSGDGRLGEEADEATVAQLLADPRAWDERALAISGAIARVTDRGFVLAHEGASIFVSAPATELEAVEAGEEVRVRAKLSRLSRYGADALDQALAAGEPGQPPGSPDAGDIPLEVGDPYLLLRAIDASP